MNRALDVAGAAPGLAVATSSGRRGTTTPCRAYDLGDRRGARKLPPPGRARDVGGRGGDAVAAVP